MLVLFSQVSSPGQELPPFTPSVSPHSKTHLAPRLAGLTSRTMQCTSLHLSGKQAITSCLMVILGQARKEAEETMIKGLLHHFLLVHPEMAPPRLQGKACTCGQDPWGGTGTWEQMCACCCPQMHATLRLEQTKAFWVTSGIPLSLPDCHGCFGYTLEAQGEFDPIHLWKCG